VRPTRPDRRSGSPEAFRLSGWTGALFPCSLATIAPQTFTAASEPANSRTDRSHSHHARRDHGGRDLSVYC
jgi:hypothetical protein